MNYSGTLEMSDQNIFNKQNCFFPLERRKNRSRMEKSSKHGGAFVKMNLNGVCVCECVC